MLTMYLGPGACEYICSTFLKHLLLQHAKVNNADPSPEIIKLFFMLNNNCLHFNIY